MANFNKVFLMGNLTRDPELRYTPSGTAVCGFGLAVNRTWKSKDGEKKEETCFVDCQAWARTAEVISEYCKKGRPLFVEGRLTFDSWEDRSGQKRSKLRVTVDNFQFIGGRGDGGGRGDRSGQGDAQRPEPPGDDADPAGDADTTKDAGGPDDGQYQVDDDIPF